MTMPLIPTFKAGQRVMVTLRPYERLCQSCGHQDIDRALKGFVRVRPLPEKKG